LAVRKITNNNTQPRHITHASLFLSKKASFTSSNSQAFLQSNTATKSGSFLAAQHYTPSNSAKVSLCDSAGVSGYDSVVVVNLIEVTVTEVEGVAVISMASLVVVFIMTLCVKEGCADGGLREEATGCAMGIV
jgi:hypothetical protein